MLNLRDRLRSFITENYMFGQAREFHDADSFLEMGIIDSTGVLELVGYLEKEFALHIEADEIIPENLDSVERLSAFLARKGVTTADRGASPAS